MRHLAVVIVMIIVWLNGFDLVSEIGGPEHQVSVGG